MAESGDRLGSLVCFHRAASQTEPGSGNENPAAAPAAYTFSNAEQQARYYKVKYYFDLNQILTPAQRQQVQDDLTKAAME